MFLRAGDSTKLMPSHGGRFETLHALLGGRMIVPGRSRAVPSWLRTKPLIR